ncbi:hypothetical protein CTAM01_15272 [Colletotrichum tamarilloi]|uniref:Heterokaryon incompatibility domain-containing protein n=1 Tax=Colletotrichum tamarilloi TaxID=1209934 RepID=A0ABQ9QLV0_9PEZI|nr:uncharacterized protein CTAM01_15272 [Colletotrichum tamarilloi]KAK1477002.1 hypothetical protein CTAM01_15272 [Colletotrichum tamarilloi]
MGQIYSRCSQVWAWIGDDLVSNDLQGLPERRWLHELGTTSSCVGTFSQSRSIRDIWKLLQRRYFRRVWVIQELVLAPRVLIPIGNVIFAADHTTARKLTQSENDSENKSKVSWKKTAAPWFEHVAQGHIGGLGLWDMMALTSKSHASDFRDKLYGILGLLSFESDNNLLQPNYAISARQMVIGFVAHCIINEGKPQLLLAAQGYSAQKNPSWLPAWETQTSWEQSFVELPDLAYNDASISSTPTEALRGVFDDLTLYRIHFGPGQWFLVGSQHPLDRLLEQDDELFALDPGLGLSSSKLKRLVYMVLRKTGDGRYRLVTGISYLCLCPASSPMFANNRYLTEIHENFYLARQKLYVQAELDKSVYDVDERSRWRLDDNIYIFPLVFPGNENTTVGHILPILTGHEGFGRLQENEVCAARGQKVIGDYLEFEFGIDFGYRPSDMKKGQCQAENAWRTFRSYMEWEWRKPGEENRLLWRRLPQLRYESNDTHEDLGLPGGMMRIHLRCRLEAVRKVIATEAQLLGITALWESRMFGDTLEAFEKNMRSEVTEEDFWVPNPGFGRSGKSLRPDEFAGLDGGTYRVCIV